MAAAPLPFFRRTFAHSRSASAASGDWVNVLMSESQMTSLFAESGVARYSRAAIASSNGEASATSFDADSNAFAAATVSLRASARRLQSLSDVQTVLRAEE